MRIRIQSCHPLPEFRAWYHLGLPNNPTNDLNNTLAGTASSSSALVVAVPGFQGRQQTISDLKELLCADLPQLHEAGIRGSDLILQLDGFDLPDGQPLPIVRDNDWIQLIPTRSFKLEELFSQQKTAQETRFQLLGHPGRVEEQSKRVIGTGHGVEGDMQIDPPSADASAAPHPTSKKRKRSPGPPNSASTPVQRSKSLSQYAATPRVPPPRSKRQSTPTKESSFSSSSDSSSDSSESDSDEDSDSDSDSTEAVNTKKDEKEKGKEKEKEKEKVDVGAESDASSSSARSEASSSSLTPLSESSSSSSYSPAKRPRKSPAKTPAKARAKPQARSGPAKATRSATRVTAVSSSPITTTKTLAASSLTATSNPSSATLAATPSISTQSQTPTSLPSSFQSRSVQPSQSQSQQQTHHVPPGHGNPQTYSRNLRRRKKKLIDKLQVEGTTIALEDQGDAGVELDHRPVQPHTQTDTSMMVDDNAPLAATAETVHAPPTQHISDPPQIQSIPVTFPSSSAIPMASPAHIPGPTSITPSAEASTSTTLDTVPTTTATPTHATPKPKPKHVSSSNALSLGTTPGSASSSRQSRARTRDRTGPAGDVALALNTAFGSNDAEGVLDLDMEDDDEEEIPAPKSSKKSTTSASAKRGSGTKPTAKKAGPSQIDSTPSTSSVAPIGGMTTALGNQPGEVMMASLGNKNKRRGFKKQLTAVVPPKIIFSSDGVPIPVQPTPLGGPVDSSMAASSSGMVAETVAMAEATVSASVASARLIPPSEWQERGQLPANMFVTSVDVEEGLGGGKRKKRRRGDDYDYGYSAAAAYGGGRELRSHTKKLLALTEGQYDDAIEDVTLDYGVGDAGSAEVSKLVAFEWQEAEKGWETYRVIERVDELCVGGLFGWKGLGMNPKTFMPEQLLIVARIISVHPEITSTGTSCRIVVRQLLRPGAKAVNFSSVRLRGVVGGEEVEEESQQNEEGEEENFEWKDVISGGWRFIQNASEVAMAS